MAKKKKAPPPDPTGFLGQLVAPAEDVAKATGSLLTGYKYEDIPQELEGGKGGPDLGSIGKDVGEYLGAKPTADTKKPKKKPDKSTSNLSQSEALQQLADYLSQNSLDTAEITAGQNLATQNQNVTSLVDQQFAAAGADS